MKNGVIPFFILYMKAKPKEGESVSQMNYHSGCAIIYLLYNENLDEKRHEKGDMKYVYEKL